MTILGVSCFFHDAAACLLQDGKPVAAASEERFTRKKHDADFPTNAIRYCLRQAKIIIDQVDYLAFYDKPFRKFDRILTQYLATFPRSHRAFLKALPVWAKQKLKMRELFTREIYYDGPIIFGEHHLSHAASAFLGSPFEEAAILTVDGVGEWDTATYGEGRGNEINLRKEIRFPHSLGLLYNAFTYYLGFRVNSDEYKVMGLAPYGKPNYVDQIREIIDLREDGSFSLNMKYFAYQHGLRMTNKRFDELFGGPPRIPESPLAQKNKDLAASIQALTEEALLRMANHLYEQTGLKNLCLAGGVALNCVANGRILRETPFENLFIQPAAGDAGGALGAASFVYHGLLGNERNFAMEHAYWGPEYSSEEIRLFLQNEEIPFRECRAEKVAHRAAQLLAEGKVVAWFQGRMEFGPRALGNRSILADPRNPNMKDILNQKIKFREGFRPFAPAVLADKASEYFELDQPNPFMLLTAQVRGDRQSEIPAVTHVDGSARVQTVSREHNPLFYQLIQEFDRQTGCPLVVNTSLNVRGEPIVCTLRDAYNCFRRSGLDVLVVGCYVIDKKELTSSVGASHPETQRAHELENWQALHFPV